MNAATAAGEIINYIAYELEHPTIPSYALTAKHRWLLVMFQFT
jgi:hypothetical protein